ncbi:unnamed protein product [Triticum turgidum subsp. durum]|uniref:Rx N-terminal domain-containing protein n=1 Tax=Triticum turgidum subsp. durum TaxID=4567 RepID=A0A9R1R0Z0_TRITD|nr:unnamed protein product [Triticum turgidum subsp. durum]
MEAVISVVTGELVSRFISFLKNKYNSSSSRAQSVKMEERLQHLLMRVSIIVEEADVRYITNSGMLLQLKMLSGAMYKGYRMLDTLRFQNHQESACFDEVRINDSSSNNLYLSIPFKRSRTKTETDDKAMRLESDGALESLEIVVANMTEFVVFLGGCERMSRRPYDIYLYTNNFMFSRHVEKQNLLTFLLEHNDFHVLRMNLTTQFWRCIFDKMTRHVKRNIYVHGAHPSKLMEQGLPVDITDFALHPLTMTSYTSNIPIKEESPSVTFAELLANPSVRPEGDFTLIRYESRIPPHKSFVHLVTSRAQDTHEGSSTLPGRKRRGVPI